AHLGGAAAPGATRVEPPPPNATQAPPADVRACTYRIRLTVHGEDAFKSLGLELSADKPLLTTRLAHIFDTDKGVLLRDGYLLQLLEEPGAFAVALEMHSCGPVAQQEDAQVATIDRHWAAGILAGCISPITVLERRFRHPLPKLISAVVTATGKQPLRRVTWRKLLRRHLGPILVPY